MGQSPFRFVATILSVSRPPREDITGGGAEEWVDRNHDQFERQ